MQQAHRERSFVVSSQGKPCFLQELAEVRAQFDGGGGLASAGGACLDEHAVRDFSRAAEKLPVRKAIVAPEPADRLALTLNKGQRRVLTHGVAQPFELPVDGVFTQCRLESFGVKEDVDVLGESLNQVPAFGEAGAAFKDDSVAAGEDAQGFGDIVVLFDDGRTQSARAKVLCGAQDGLLEIVMFE